MRHPLGRSLRLPVSSFAIAIHVAQIARDLGLSPPEIEIYCDNQAAIATAKNPTQQSRAKHIDTSYHFIIDWVESGKAGLVPYTGKATDGQRRRYLQCLGTIGHLAQWTRPDISAAHSLAARYCQNPGPDHFQALGQILGYLLYTKDYKMP